jgi:hypothetical protein
LSFIGAGNANTGSLAAEIGAACRLVSIQLVLITKRLAERLTGKHAAGGW